jgi:hypothetical protein
MSESNQAGRAQLLRTIRRELSFFDARGYGHPFRSEWRPTLLLRDSPVCINYSSTGQQHSCSHCPLFPLVPPGAEHTPVPCHQIALDASGTTIAGLYQKGTQRQLDQRYREWLCRFIQEFENI